MVYRVHCSPGRIPDAGGDIDIGGESRVKYAGTGSPSWFDTLADARAHCDRDSGEFIKAYSALDTTRAMFEVF
jgi:hypothetical protein